MKFTLQVVTEDDEGERKLEDMITLEKSTGASDLAGLSLTESKHVLQSLETLIVQQQADEYTRTHRCCLDCQGKRRELVQTRVPCHTEEYGRHVEFAPFPGQPLNAIPIAEFVGDISPNVRENDGVSEMSAIEIF